MMVIPGRQDGTIFPFSLRQAELLKTRGYDVVCHYVSTDMGILDPIREVRKLRVSIQKSKPTIVHVHYGIIYGFIATLSTNLPKVITFHGTDLNPQPIGGYVKNAISKFLSQLSALNVDRIICVSNMLKGRLWWRKNIVDIIPMGINRSKFYRIDKKKARKSLGWHNDDRVVFFNIGYNPLVKRYDFAKEVVKKAEQLCGPIRMEALNNNVPYEKIPLYINASDCVLVTSSSEGGPLVVKEAICCGVPVVSVDVGDVSVRLEKIKGASVVNNTDIDLAHAICDVFSRDTVFYSEKAAEEVDEEKLLDEVIAIYKKISN